MSIVSSTLTPFSEEAIVGTIGQSLSEHGLVYTDSSAESGHSRAVDASAGNVPDALEYWYRTHKGHIRQFSDIQELGQFWDWLRYGGGRVGLSPLVIHVTKDSDDPVRVCRLQNADYVGEGIVEDDYKSDVLQAFEMRLGGKGSNAEVRKLARGWYALRADLRLQSYGTGRPTVQIEETEYGKLNVWTYKRSAEV